MKVTLIKTHTLYALNVVGLGFVWKNIINKANPMNKDKIQKAWEEYHGPIECDGSIDFDGTDDHIEGYIPMMPPAFMRGYVDGYEQGKKDALNARDTDKDFGT